MMDFFRPIRFLVISPLRRAGFAQYLFVFIRLCLKAEARANGFGAEILLRAPKLYIHTARGSEGG